MMVSLLPEIFIIISAILILSYGVYKGKGINRICVNLGLLTLFISFILLLILNNKIDGLGYEIIQNQLTVHKGKYGLFKFDGFSLFSRYIIIISSFITLILSREYLNHKSFARFEFTSIYLIATIGLLFSVLSNNLFTLYLSLELAINSILYLVTYKRRAYRSTEAGVKYTLMNIFSSALIIFAISILYGYSGKLDYDYLSIISENYKNTYMFVLSFIILIIGILSKLALFPLNLWFSDAIEGSPTAVSAYLSTTVQATLFLIVIKLLLVPFISLIEIWRPVLVIIAISSIFVSAIAANNQTNIKRFLGYVVVFCSGMFLLFLINPTLLSVSTSFYYIVSYTITMLLAYTLMLSLRIKENLIENISDLSGFFYHKKYLAFSITILFASIIGLPPTAGFISKSMLIIPLINTKSIFIISMIMISSLIMAYSLLKILKIVYFDTSANEIDNKISPLLLLLITILTLCLMLFFINPDMLMKYCIMIVR